VLAGGVLAGGVLAGGVLAGGVLAGVLGVIVGGLMAVVVVLMIWLSIALSGPFTIFPATLLHALLRAIGR
jgi:hypothetical protein